MLTHFLRMVRGILLKGNGIIETLPHLWADRPVPADGGGDRLETLPEDAGLAVDWCVGRTLPPELQKNTRPLRSMVA